VTATSTSGSTNVSISPSLDSTNKSKTEATKRSTGSNVLVSLPPLNLPPSHFKITPSFGATPSFSPSVILPSQIPMEYGQKVHFGYIPLSINQSINQPFIHFIDSFFVFTSIDSFFRFVFSRQENTNKESISNVRGSDVTNLQPTKTSASSISSETKSPIESGPQQSQSQLQPQFQLLGKPQLPQPPSSIPISLSTGIQIALCSLSLSIFVEK
jgi:hypothetical protein